MAKPFFFRIDLIELMDFATEPEGEAMSLLQFAKELKRGQSDHPTIQKIIDEANNYIEKKKKAGSSGGKAKASSARASLEQTQTVLEQNVADPYPEAVTEAEENKKHILDFFESLWKDYPSHDGKKAALRHYTATVKSEDDCQRIRTALDNYLDHLSRETWKKPKNGSTWFNNWSDWEEWKPQTQTRQPHITTLEELTQYPLDDRPKILASLPPEIAASIRDEVSRMPKQLAY